MTFVYYLGAKVEEYKNLTIDLICVILGNAPLVKKFRGKENKIYGGILHVVW